jgi:hypothetical protein
MCEIKGVKKILFEKKIMKIVSKLKNNNDVPGFVWITGKNREEIEKSYNEVISNIKVSYL